MLQLQISNCPNIFLMEKQINSQLQLAFDFVSSTNQNIFLTGKAGTGKTTFLYDLKQKTFKRMVVVAPTGVAAINAGGVTIHSFFQLSFGPQIPGGNAFSTHRSDRANSFKRFSKEKINIIRSLDLLVIDEISMVRADVLDGIDEVLRRYRDRGKPFGGVQLLMIGDLQQLAPIVKDEEWEILKPYYDTGFFFSSRALREASFQSIELKQIFRQNDEDFIYLLNKIRENTIESKELDALNKRCIPGFNPDDEDGYITLTTHNYQANAINKAKLSELKQQAYTYKARVNDDFPEFMYPTEPELTLKKGAQVMFVKNDSSPEKRYYNGKIGKISEINTTGITVVCEGDDAVVVEHERWDNTKYALNEETQEIQENVIGSFEQYPLKLAWAITIHKSQGLTFEKAIINARQSFAHGQVYVALSRCKSLEGMVLSAPIDLQSIKNDASVLSFTKDAEEHQPTAADLKKSRLNYQQFLLSDLFDFKAMESQIQYILYVCRENQNALIGNLADHLALALPVLKTEILAVSEKFKLQIDQLIALSDDVEQNTVLQERVSKACHYFSEKLEAGVSQPVKASDFETDNKKVQKRLNDAMEKLLRELKIKTQVFRVCKNGFRMSDFLETRAKASIDSSVKWKNGKRSKVASGTSKNPDFYKQIRAWRNKKAETLSVSTSRILRQATLVEIAEHLPANVKDLKSIRGMGGKKMQQVGKEILEMTIRYRRAKGMDIPLNADDEPGKALLDSKGISFKLFKSGKSPIEISQERGIAISTVEGHLVHFVDQEDFDLERLVTKEKQHRILHEIKKNPSRSITDIKQGMDEDIRYSEIRFIMAAQSAKHF